MTHRSADRLSEAIDRLIGRGDSGHAGHLQEVMNSLARAFPDVADEVARERVRNRVKSYHPSTTSPQQLLLERAGDGLERIARGVSGEEYVPWPTVVGAAAVVVVAAAVLVFLRRRGVQEPVSD
jgi:hypothetical protein